MSVGTLAATLVLSAVSLRWIEQPVIRLNRAPARLRVTAVAAVAAVSILAAGVSTMTALRR
jgi:peptidoglycan/LPS O-acetylase OafA/YrhL